MYLVVFNADFKMILTTLYRVVVIEFKTHLGRCPRTKLSQEKSVNDNYIARKIEDVGRLPRRVVDDFELFILSVSAPPPRIFRL